MTTIKPQLLSPPSTQPTMPKVFTRAIVSSSDQASATQSSRAVLRSYYCLCGDFLLVIQGKLDRLPRRKCVHPTPSTLRYALDKPTKLTLFFSSYRTDGAYIIRSQPGAKAPARKFKLNAQPGQRVTVKRKGSDNLEIRQPFVCSRCKTPGEWEIGV